MDFLRFRNSKGFLCFLRNDCLFESISSYFRHLYWFAAEVNGGNNTINGKLMADIEVNENVVTSDGSLNGDGSSFRIWIPIGTNNTKTYNGTFDGNKKSISGLYYNTSPNYFGLFGRVGNKGLVKNVVVTDSYLQGRFSVGGVVGWNEGDIINCNNTGNVTVSGFSSYDYIGGVVGVNYGSVCECSNSGNISGNDNVGGIVGLNYGTISRCYNDASVSSNASYDYVGGVVGRNYNGNVINCYNTGNISGSAPYSCVGGVVGYNEELCTITNCYNTGDTVGSISGSYIGGVVGRNFSIVSNCYLLGSFDSIGNDYGQVKTSEQFASGEVAYLLGEPFGQLLGIETAPVLGGNTVYRNQIGGCTTGTYTYAYENEERTLITHNWSDATCTTPKTCATCGTTDGNVLQHSFGETTVHKPAPGVMGYSEHTCTACGHTEQFDFVELQGFTVSGLINSFLLDGEIKIELLVDREVQYSIVVVGSNVRYDIEDVVSGTYTLRISKGNHVTREYEVVVGQEDVRIDAIICPIGDVTGDGVVNIKDFQRLLKHVNRTDPLEGYALTCGNVTNDNACNIKDFQRLLKHVNRTQPLF